MPLRRDGMLALGLVRLSARKYWRYSKARFRKQHGPVTQSILLPMPLPVPTGTGWHAVALYARFGWLILNRLYREILDRTRNLFKPMRRACRYHHDVAFREVMRLTTLNVGAKPLVRP